MIPLSISASSLDVASKCLAQWKATSFERGSGIGNPAAMLGSTLHLALENYTAPEILAKRDWDFSVLYQMYLDAFKEIWGTFPANSEQWFQEGLEIIRKWYERPDQASDLWDVDIISREVKKSFDVPYIDPTDGTKKFVPFNYIIDRLDKLDEGEYRVVDYKSQRVPLQPDELKFKIQPRAYALAVQIAYPDAVKIWVQYDFLRYDRVGTLFTRDDQVETWANIKQMLQRIVDTPANNAPETLNEGCRYCVRRITCNTVQSNIRVGGIFAMSIEELVQKYYEIKSVLDANKMTLDDIDGAVMRHLAETDQTELDLPFAKVKVTSKRTRTVNRDLASQILGPELMAQYGRLNVSDIDALRKDPRMSPAQLSLLDTAISFKTSDPSLKIVRKS